MGERRGRSPERRGDRKFENERQPREDPPPSFGLPPRSDRDRHEWRPRNAGGWRGRGGPPIHRDRYDDDRFRGPRYEPRRSHLEFDGGHDRPKPPAQRKPGVDPADRERDTALDYIVPRGNYFDHDNRDRSPGRRGDRFGGGGGRRFDRDRDGGGRGDSDRGGRHWRGAESRNWRGGRGGFGGPTRGDSEGQWQHDMFAIRQQRAEQRAQWEAKKQQGGAAASTEGGAGEKEAKADEADANTPSPSTKANKPAEEEEPQAALDV